MATVIKGKEVADWLTEEALARVERLKSSGIQPALAILRVGNKPGDLAYERAAMKRAEKTGVDVRQVVLEEDVSQEKLLEEIDKLNRDESIHGVLIFRPLPEQIDEAFVCDQLAPEKDVDGITSGSMAGVFMGTEQGFPPCTAEACMAILDYYGIDLKGKKVTVMGRSLVIGKPAAMMAMKRNGTVTVLHSRTREDDFRRAGQNADVVITAMGRAKMVGPDLLGEDQVILDVGINEDENGDLCGDVDFAGAEPNAAMITPVPGGVGSVTTAILMDHVLAAAEKKGRV